MADKCKIDEALWADRDAARELEGAASEGNGLGTFGRTSRWETFSAARLRQSAVLSSLSDEEFLVYFRLWRASGA